MSIITMIIIVVVLLAASLAFSFFIEGYQGKASKSLMDDMQHGKNPLERSDREGNHGRSKAKHLKRAG